MAFDIGAERAKGTVFDAVTHERQPVVSREEKCSRVLGTDFRIRAAEGDRRRLRIDRNALIVAVVPGEQRRDTIEWPGTSEAGDSRVPSVGTDDEPCLRDPLLAGMFEDNTGDPAVVP